MFREIVKSALKSDGLANALQGGGGGSDGGASGKHGSNGSGGLSGMKGLAAGAGAAALAPLAVKNAGKLARSLGKDNLGDAVESPGEALEGAKSNLGDRLTSSVKDKAKGALDEAGGPGGIAKDAAKQMLPFGGGDGDGGGGKGGGAEGVGKGRRMPVQQIVDIGIPIESVYNQFTQFEDWPQFMHRVKRVTREDDCTVSFAVKIWGKTKEFMAKIDTQRPDQRIKWKASQGMTHSGVVTFHELGPNLTRVILNFDVDPGSLVEKFARGARHVKRAARAELHRFVAFIEMAEHETGAWRGVIEDGELVEEHDPSYDEQREYSDIEELTGQDDSDEDEDEDEEGDEDHRGDDQSEDEEESPKARRSQRQQRSASNDRQKRDRGGEAQQRQSARSRQPSSSGRGSSGGSGRSSSGRSSSARSSSGGSSGGQSRSGSSRREGGGGSSSSGGGRARSGSSRQSNSSASSRSGGRSRSSGGSSGGQSRSRSRSQSRNG